MKERGIIFSGPMVRAVIAGTKTQTRRMYRPRTVDNVDDPLGALFSLPTPYGSPGDRLWVRETWAAQHDFDAFKPSEINWDARWHYAATEERGGLRWRPSIVMPRWASRITLEIAELRVQRLQEISDEDARAEGVDPYTPPYGHISPDQCVPGPGFGRCRLGDQPHRLPFADAWELINGKRAPWESNPWVWAITFRRVP